MVSITTHSDPSALAEAAALRAIQIIQESISETGRCTWVIAGGSTPVAAYEVIAKKYLDAVNWSKVTILMGDERIVPLDSPDSNWHQAEQALLKHVPEAHLLRPRSDLSLDEATSDYDARISQLAKTHSQHQLFDLIWLGMGEDGHTLSLFPGRQASFIDDRYVIPVSDSPKPPSERLTLNLKALRETKQVHVLVAGASKALATARALKNQSLPILEATNAVNESGGIVEWLIDEAAASLIDNTSII